MSKNANEFKIVGKVVTTPIKESGNTNNKDWHKLRFQVSTEIEYSEKYTETNTIDISLFGKAIDKVVNVQVGEIVKLKGSIKSNAVPNMRGDIMWFTNLKVFSAEIVGGEKERNKKDDADDIYQDLDSQNLPF